MRSNTIKDVPFSPYSISVSHSFYASTIPSAIKRIERQKREGGKTTRVYDDELVIDD
jgi:hypothetical protein